MPIRVAVGILQREGKVLVAKRPEDKPYAGYWEFPGGKIELGETGQDAISRELHEELGISVERARFWFDHQHVYPDKTVLLELWLIDIFQGEPHSKEMQELRWVSLAEMDALKLLEGNVAIMEKIKALL